MADADPGDELLPGELCAQSGIYRVIHHLHRTGYNVLVHAGDRFPPCKRCGEAVRFRLVEQMEQPAAMRPKGARKKSAGR